MRAKAVIAIINKTGPERYEYRCQYGGCTWSHRGPHIRYLESKFVDHRLNWHKHSQEIINKETLAATIIRNAEIGWWEDGEGCLICHSCGCPLVMHYNTLGCGAKEDACQNPKCEKKRSN